MKRLPKAKRDQVIAVGIGTLVLVAVIVFGLIRPQYAATSQINGRITAARKRLQSMETSIKHVGTVTNQLAHVTATLTHAQRDMASGDPAQWIYNTIRNFNEHYHLNISVTSQLSTGELDLLPDFPYNQLKVTVAGTAYYHDLGKFIAAFENAFPHVQITDLNLEPAGNKTERLSFRMDIVALASAETPQS